MASPFVYEDPVSSEDLADRREELGRLRDRIGDTRNSRLEGARRFGKTSLLRAALGQAERDGLIPIYVNFLGVLTLGDVA
jgi:AAA+ ATPase superfamily predicted ATPase